MSAAAEAEEELCASEWHYRGEGAANIVLGYHSSSPRFVGKVLRLQKLSSSQQHHTPFPVLSSEEQFLWSDWPAVAAATSEEILTQAFARDVISPLLGHNYVDPGTLVHVPKEFLETVEKDIYEKRPEWRRKGSQIDVMRKAALLISDHSLFPIARGAEWNLPSSISVEIKPKCGFLPSSTFIAKENSVKTRVSRFEMHQYLKFSQGKIDRQSQYSPVDLFSGSYERMHHAIQALFETPQNNLRVFVDGVLVFGTSVGNPDKEEVCSAFQDLDHALEKVTPCTKGEGLEVLQKIVIDLFAKTKILNRLLAVQMLDLYDIEGVIHAFNKIVQKYNGLTYANKKPEKNKGNELQRNGITEWVNGLTLEDSKKIVRDYLIAATAKDCSIMLTFQPLPAGKNVGTSLDGCTLVTCPESGQDFRCKVHFVDLDLKRLKKIPYYLKLDQEIVKCYLRTIKLEPIEEPQA